MHRTLLLAGTAALVGFSAGEAIAQDTLAAIQERGRAVVATEAAFEPFEFLRDGEIVGFGSDLLAEVIADLGVEVEQLDVPFQGILAGLEAGQYDFIATSVAVTPERAERYAFTRPFAAISNVLVVAAGNDAVQSVEDLSGLLVATQLGSSTEGVARAVDAELRAAGGAGFGDLRLYPTFPETVFALTTGQVDALVIGNLTVGAFLNEQPDALRVVASIGEPVWVSWVVRQEDEALLAAINATFTRLIESGEMTRLQEEWVGVAMPTPADGFLP